VDASACDGDGTGLHRRVRHARALSVPPLYAVVAFVALERLAEVIHAERNARALRRRGAREAARVQYPFFVALHLAWLLSMLLLIPASASVNWILIGVYAALQIARFWVVAALGDRFTTRVIVLP
jgi:methyltransferase